MKKITAIILSALILMSFGGCKEASEKTEGEKTKKEETATTEQQDNSVKYTDYESLTDEFMRCCEEGDLEGMYSLYYDDMLTKLYERISGEMSKQDFDSLLLMEMETIYSFEEFVYGCPEMPAMSSPLSYVNQILYYSGGESLNIDESRVTNCVDLRVYKNDGSAPTDHMMACIDGNWYFIL